MLQLSSRLSWVAWTSELELFVHWFESDFIVLFACLYVFQRVADRLYGVYKVHGNYGRVFRWEVETYEAQTHPSTLAYIL